MSPAGTATAMAMAETSVVPSSSGSTPNFWFEKSGVHSVPVRNSRIGTSRKNANVSTASTTMMPAVVPTETRAHRNRSSSMTRSPRR